jgi:hypothetical protein
MDVVRMGGAYGSICARRKAHHHLLLLLLLLQAAYLVMGHVGGKLLLFQAGLPTLGPGRLKPSRDNLNLYSTEREAQLRNPEDPFFKRFAGEASSRQITLDVFLATNGYADLASLSSIPRYTCGQVRGAGGGGGRCVRCAASNVCCTSCAVQASHPGLGQPSSLQYCCANQAPMSGSV